MNEEHLYFILAVTIAVLTLIETIGLIVILRQAIKTGKEISKSIKENKNE